MPKCKHDWTRTNAVTTTDGKDIFRCNLCGAQGESFGLSNIITPMQVDIKQKVYRGMTATRTRGKSLETILKESKERGDPKKNWEWSVKQYKKRMVEDFT